MILPQCHAIGVSKFPRHSQDGKLTCRRPLLFNTSATASSPGLATALARDLPVAIWPVLAVWVGAKPFSDNLLPELVDLLASGPGHYVEFVRDLRWENLASGGGAVVSPVRIEHEALAKEIWSLETRLGFVQEVEVSSGVGKAQDGEEVLEACEAGTCVWE